MNHYLKLQNGSDIRGVSLKGITGEDINLTDKEAFYISISFAHWLADRLNKPINELKVAIGSDSRLSAEIIKTGIFRGLNTLSIEPYNCGLASTPSMFMSTQFEETNTDGAIMITASHLPFNKNGMKFFTKEGGLSKKDISALISGIDESVEYTDTDYRVKDYDLISHYSSHIVDIIRREVNASNYDYPLANTKIIVDAGNGAGGFFAPKVLRVLGADTTGSQFLDPDGRFPNHIPNPEDTDAINSIIDATIQSNAELGIIFDTDVDRAAVIDSNGKAINRNRLIALMSAITLEENQGSTIVTDSVTSTGLTEFIEGLGGIHHRFKRGYKNVIDESIRLNNEGIHSGLAIETSGHGAFKDNFFLDDGAYIVTKTLIKFAKLKEEGREISSLIASLVEPKDVFSIRVKINLTEFSEYGQQILKDFNALVEAREELELATPNFEGVRVNYDLDGQKGWMLVRMSLHDPVLAINIESNDEDGCSKAKAFIYDFLEGYDKLIIKKA